MDVGFFMIFASYGWDNQSDGETWQEELKLADMAAEWLVEEGNGQAKWGPRMGTHIDCAGRLALFSFGRKYHSMMKPSERDYDSDWVPLWSWMCGVAGILPGSMATGFTLVDNHSEFIA